MQLWHAEAIWESVEPDLPGFTVEVLPEIDSTSTELMRRARAGQPEPVLLVAERQTAGRGRMGRPWASGPGGAAGSAGPDVESNALPSLTFSLGLMLAPADWSGLSLAVGVAVAESLSAEVGLKWPNDLWLKDGVDRKLGGILIETATPPGAMFTSTSAFTSRTLHASRYAVIGIGINVLARDGDGLSMKPASLAEIWPEASAAGALARIAPQLVRAVQQFERDGFAPFAARFASRDVLAGRSVQFSDGMSGTARGVSADGSLVVHTADGLRRVASSEVSVRPVPSSTAS